MVMGTIKIDDDKNAGKLLAILITMPMRRYDGGGHCLMEHIQGFTQSH
jgi:hypothetical protein